jgi:hypothetical protein
VDFHEIVPNRLAFGGIHVVFAGDFMQLPPVGADLIFVDPESKVTVPFEDFDGFQLWRQFGTVVVLRESVQFKDDPAWGEGCSKARYGECTPAFVAMINERVVTRLHEYSRTPPSLPPGTIFVTPDNDTRSAINNFFVSCAGNYLPPGALPIRVIANFKGALNNLSIADVKHIMGLPDTKFVRMARYLDLIPGMPIQITQNIRTKKGVANGTIGYLHNVEVPANASFQRVLDRRSGAYVLLPDKCPLYALVGLHRGEHALPIKDGINPELFPVFPDVEAYLKSVIRLTQSNAGN